MINKITNKNKGVSLISLIITVIVILILTNVVAYNAVDGLRTTKLSNMQADIENLRDRVSTYYAQYGKIPADTSIEYTNINNINSISEAVDTGKFYVIDLAAMENITLNYGKDYEKIRSGAVTEESEINQLTDLYIINETSHNVFYVKGIESGGEVFYTDYSAENKDTVEVKLYGNRKYTDINGDTAIIPEGFVIVEGLDVIEDGLVITDESGNEFVWIPVETPVSITEASGTANKAMAIKNGENYRGLLYSFTSSGSTVRSGCTTTTRDYREPAYLASSSYADESSYNQDEDGNKIVTEDSLQKEYNKMMTSVEKFHGFYLGRYELGLEGTTPVVKNASMNTEVTTANASNSNTYRWYGLYAKCKEFATEEDNNKSVVSTMIWGSQYDAMMNWMHASGVDMTEPADGTNTIRNTSTITGSQEKDVIKNVFDLYGCYGEWTLEAFTTNSRAIFGGNSFFDGAPNFCNVLYAPYNDLNYSSTRITLYIK